MFDAAKAEFEASWRRWKAWRRSKGRRRTVEDKPTSGNVRYRSLGRSEISGIIVMRRVRFKCCGGTTVPGLHLRRNHFLWLRNTIETECMQHGCRIGTDEVSPLRHSPNPCLGRELWRMIRCQRKAAAPRPFSFAASGSAPQPFCRSAAGSLIWQSNCQTRVSASGCNVHFAPRLAWIGVYANARYRLLSKVKPRRRGAGGAQ